MIKGRLRPEKTGINLLCSLSQAKTVLNGLRWVGLQSLIMQDGERNERKGGREGESKGGREEEDGCMHESYQVHTKGELRMFQARLNERDRRNK